MPEFESRLGTPEEALYRAEAMRTTRGYSRSSMYKTLYVYSINGKINKQQHATRPLLVEKFISYFCPIHIAS
jgi:hypothetical protein